MQSLQARYRVAILVFFALCTPLVGYGAKGAWDSIENRVQDWLPESFDETQRLMWYYEHFGSDELLMISWPGCTLDDPRLPHYKSLLGAEAPIDGRRAAWFDEIFTGPEALDGLTNEPLDLSRAAAIERLDGWLIGPDGRTTCLVALVSPAGEGDRRSAIDYAYACADDVPGLSTEQLIVAGTTRDGVAIDRVSKASLAQLNLASFAVSIAIMFFALRSVRLTAIVFLTAIFCEQLSMSIMYFSGQPLDSVLTLASNLTYVLAIAAGIHLVNYYREARRDMPHEEAVGWAVRAALAPTALSAGTTALGMISLTISEIRPITNFGLYAALSILAGAAVLLLLVPAALYQWPPTKKSLRRETDPTVSTSRIWPHLARGIQRLRWPITVGALLVIGVSLLGVRKIETSVQLHDLFSPRADIIHDYAWLEEHIGPLIPIEVVLRIPESAELQIDERLRLVRRTQQAVAQATGVRATISAATFAPEMPRADLGGFRAVARRAVLRARLEGSLDEFSDANYLRHEGDDQLWRISARVPAGERLDYGAVMRDIRATVSEQLAAFESVEPIYSGSVPLIYKAQSEMLDDLIESFLLAFVMIAAMMVVLVRGLRLGVMAMAPNVLPTLLVFGLMGAMGISVELGSMLTATVALGIAVDDSLHYITWFRRGLARGLSGVEAASNAYAHCGRAMIQTTLICSFGLLVFALSPFTPIARFAWLMFTLLQLALVSDLLLLPAILLCFTGRKRSAPLPAEIPEAAEVR